ncbi:hypothetical protein HOP50_18g82290 [Chloropicon primus]|uniref:Uncharacterized protein n=1 Tax=Chloropicon primus TaxID=1764295 RepID=A0A5B8MY51_9CHLO|nr:hypothetical protein A3770_18p82060 [Chloropicon primus]UPR04884.1 hypothetical protein HOP50_18g82290 [Chloropicon primus]|mmetsp:Transcript_5856/g.12411  ORF Transcript_5856/g.12411 Transcript_5856/m.12411 type:complete len:191 (-) Transcript_5856:183-755(-)|eukprot:QDZ25688.1 hypothetical protein A3770_18p82060 [Chloropicon primus]
MDPVASCSGCEHVKNFLEASHYYALDLKRAGKPYRHVLPEKDADVCSSSFLSHFHGREDVFGFQSFVHKGSSQGRRDGPLNSFCLQMYREDPIRFHSVLAEGNGAETMCSVQCNASKSLTLLDKLEYATFHKGSNQLLRLAPYGIMLLLLLGMVSHYGYTCARRAWAWSFAGRQKETNALERKKKKKKKT